MAISKKDLPAFPDCIPRARGSFSRNIGFAVLNVLGWKITGQLPNKSKFVAAVAPHTSNWDFVVAISAMLAMNLRIRFMAKNALFIWPFKSILHSWGGIAIDRNATHGVVEQMVDKFNQEQQLILAIAPEGTRRKTKEWKSGFLYIAHHAKVPVVPVSLDFFRKEIRFHPEKEISENIEHELIAIKGVFADICAKNPQSA